MIVDTSTKRTIDFAPTTVTAEVLQNVYTILTTIKGTVALDRSFGITGSRVDRPIQQAQAYMTNDIFRAIRRFEPRAKIKEIQFKADMEGKLQAVAEVEVIETE